MIGWDSRDTLLASVGCSSGEPERWKVNGVGVGRHLIPFQENSAPPPDRGAFWGQPWGTEWLSIRGCYKPGRGSSEAEG